MHKGVSNAPRWMILETELDQTTSSLYSYFGVLHTGWLPVTEAAKKKKQLKTPKKNVLLLHKSRLGFIYFKSLSLKIIFTSSSKDVAENHNFSFCLAECKTRLWALFEEARITACDGTQSVRDWRHSRFKLHWEYRALCKIRYSPVRFQVWATIVSYFSGSTWEMSYIRSLCWLCDHGRMLYCEWGNSCGCTCCCNERWLTCKKKKKKYITNILSFVWHYTKTHLKH